ncbi:energy-coupling factor ABC transporter ATP-binding protein [Desulfatitalea alkaliphila]|uniref:Energy-coupling factor ABC transporter ATP-binding protein n=1 Tax=Desulfatitalea alkaliphila TaxID=2929485 RepID=A0AA41RCI5_9BACT|nr:ABC transporter ATP-binding protein [Desulfatitalea alkaliphila]MCJ8502523.1 energy-coupling factor ABC transporter ATP-binding protein [Desulfatitalea alkaliphila]
MPPHDHHHPILATQGLSHRFKPSGRGLHDITLSIPRGQFVVLAGPNGSGKSTLLRHFNGLLTPRAGTVWLDGVPVAADPARARRMVGLVFQDAESQIVGETVRDDIAFGPENLCWSCDAVDAAVRAAMDQLGLTHLADESPHLLSGGERRRLAIAGVLAMGPEVVMLDEPFANLDYPGIREVLRQVVAMHGQGRTILLAAHDLEKVVGHAQRLIIMDKGRIAADGPVVDVLPLVEQYDVRLPCQARLGMSVTSWLN